MNGQLVSGQLLTDEIETEDSGVSTQIKLKVTKVKTGLAKRSPGECPCHNGILKQCTTSLE